MGRMPVSATMLSAIENAKVTGEILNVYIAIHNDIFRPWWRRVMPFAKWFDAIDFHGHLVSLKALEEELEAIQEAVARDCDGTRRFPKALLHYCKALTEAMRHLRVICAGLDAKRTASDSYPWKEYRQDNADYDAHVRAYQVLGAALNRELELIRAGIGR